jgi:hypothetical protein
MFQRDDVEISVNLPIEIICNLKIISLMTLEIVTQ